MVDQYQDEPQGGSPLGYGGGSYSNPMYNFAGSITELTDTEALLLRLESGLRGELVRDDGSKLVVGERLLNENGIGKIISVVRSAGSQSSVMSDFERGEVMVIMEYLNDTLAKDLLVNRVNYGIVSPSTRDSVVFMANACTFAILKRGFEGGERRFWKGSQQEVTFKGDSSKRSGGGLFSGLFKK